MGLNDQAHSKLKYLIFEMCDMGGGKPKNVSPTCGMHLYGWKDVLGLYFIFLYENAHGTSPLHVSCNLDAMLSKYGLRPKF